MDRFANFFTLSFSRSGRSLRGRGRSLVASLSLATLLLPSLAHAGPRDDMKAAYDKALADANNLEYDAALGTLNGAIAAAESSGNQDDPVLASLYLLRAALIFSAEGSGAKDRILADLQRSVTLNYYVVVPVELRSDDLDKYMQQARKATGASPPQPITLRDPVESCGAPLHFEVLLSVPDGGTAALYWRKAGTDAEFAGTEMPAFSNVAEVDVPAADHGDASIEYFIYAFDASSNPVANLGLQDQPLTLEQTCEAEVVDPVVEPEKDPDGDGGKKGPKGGPTALPRVWINIGLGTGFGIARVEAENTYRQFFPRGDQAYGPAEAGCAIARWVAGEDREVTSLSAMELSTAFDLFGAPGTQASMMASFNADSCAERHPVSTGFAPAPFHIAPEISVRIGKRISLGLFSRLQVVTGAQVFRDDPNKDLTTSFMQDIRSADPQGVKQQIKFSWAIGAKLKYFLGKDQWKIRPFVGAFVGYGHSRLRVDMGFANDRNGNSVPDDLEIGSDVDLTGSGCFPVWPYNNACSDPQTGGDNLLALTVAQNASGGNRIDVVRIGPAFFGALAGFNYQIVKNFALFGEIAIGGWLPNQSSMLIDLTVGPAITF
jgi:hypothetical protein